MDGPNDKPNAFFVRPGVSGDALAILEAHRSSVRAIAASSYSAEVVDSWAPASISPDRIATFARAIERGEQIVLVAEDETGRIVAFGAIVPGNSELRALYVRAEHGRRGIGRAILAQLEAVAREAGVTVLRMSASVNAAGFYAANGYSEIERGELTLQSGVRMDCVRMSKSLGPGAEPQKSAC